NETATAVVLREHTQQEVKINAADLLLLMALELSWEVGNLRMQADQLSRPLALPSGLETVEAGDLQSQDAGGSLESGSGATDSFLADLAFNAVFGGLSIPLTLSAYGLNAVSSFTNDNVEGSNPALNHLAKVSVAGFSFLSGTAAVITTLAVANNVAGSPWGAVGAYVGLGGLFTATTHLWGLPVMTWSGYQAAWQNDDFDVVEL
ncbi:MAG TPA: hypothetical protein PLV25_05825, partial [Opitutales bacterium]|nr:hypothetical protein [Opitutales bacterium]